LLSGSLTIKLIEINCQGRSGTAFGCNGPLGFAGKILVH
jgi:hypothetical protein